MNNTNNGSVNSGSPIQSAPSANSLGDSTGQAQKKESLTVEEVTNLQSLVGRQGNELGEYRQFFENIAPLLEKLDKSPEVVQAILNDKLTADLAKAAMEGKISVTDAAIVSKAHSEVKKDLGKKYDVSSSEDIAKLVDEKVSAVKTEFEGKLKEVEESAAFEKQVNEFINRTDDFAQYAESIDKWLDTHDVTDIAVAYYAVKGELSTKEAQKKAAEDKAEFEKNLAVQGSGQGRTTYMRNDPALIDQLIGGKSNPNVF